LDQKLLLNEALSFLHLTESSNEQELKTSYHGLAKKYHPDSGEYDSDILFRELQKQYEFLKAHYANYGNFKLPGVSIPDESITKKSKTKKDPIFELYKTAKDRETRAILSYFEKTKNSPLHLDEKGNKSLEGLRKDLDPVRKIYLEILSLYPESIWAKDSKESLQRISVWWK